MSSPPPSFSPASSAGILTPSRKVKALLARFDDSEDSDHGNSGGQSTQRDTERAFPVAKHKAFASTDKSDDDDDDDDDVPVVTKNKSRMAARLDDSGHDGSADSANELESNKLRMAPAEPGLSPAVHSDGSDGSDGSDDHLQLAAPHRRRLLINRKRRSRSPSQLLHSPPSAPSPMFFPSPSAAPEAVSPSAARPGSDSDDLPEDPLSGSKEKLHALVEKHRKQRREREAAEAAKKEKREKMQSEALAEESDASGEADESEGRKLTQAAKPTRKASKKAREEMARETQRMSRSMQLTHQARTRKKFSKDSLLARFNWALPTPAISQQQQPQSDFRSGEDSSHASSDVEPGHHTTPPTSPLPASPDHVKSNRLAPATDSLIIQAPQSLQDLQPPSLTNNTNNDKGKGKALEEPTNRSEAALAAPAAPAALPEKRARLLEVLSKSISDSEDVDLEIITAPSELPKYVPFEKLPRRMATETQSHRVLRALAHVPETGKNSRSSMTMAELELSLKIRARLQAKQERQERIQQLRAMGKDIRTAEERERDENEIEDLVEKARQEAAELQKREKELAKKDGTYVKDGIDSDDSDDQDFDDIDQDVVSGESEEEEEEEQEEEDEEEEEGGDNDDGDADDADVDDVEEMSTNSDKELVNDGADDEDSDSMDVELPGHGRNLPPRKPRQSRVVVDEEDEDKAAETEIKTQAQHQTDSPIHQGQAKTPQSLTRSARKIIPGLNMSDDLPMDLSQAFAATMADSQTQSGTPAWEGDSYDIPQEAPSPGEVVIPQLSRLDSLDLVSNSQPSQTLPLGMDFSLSQTQCVPASPLVTRGPSQSQLTPSRVLFEPTQDAGYVYSPFKGNRFDTPQQLVPDSTIETLIISNKLDSSPLMERKGRLRRGRVAVEAESDEETADEANVGTDRSNSAFDTMKRAARKAEQQQQAFDKSKSNAREIVDEAAEESDDEYAGLGGASDDEEEVENEDDRRMIDNDTGVGQGDEAKLASHFADRERKEDEAAVQKLMNDITTGALRRKRGAHDDLDLSDDEAEAAARRRKAKQRQFARMHRELLKDEAVGKIAEDKKKEAFLKSIEDRDPISDDDLDLDQPETSAEEWQSQSQSQQQSATDKRPLNTITDSRLNHRRSQHSHNKKPKTLAEIRETVSFFLEEPDSQAAMIDLGLSDSEDEPEAYVDLDRHLKAAEADENVLEDGDGDGLADFIVDDNRPDKNETHGGSDLSDKLAFPLRQPFGQRRTRVNVVNRASLLRQSSSAGSNNSNSSSSSTTKMAFYSSSSSSTTTFKGPMLLRRATTNSALTSFTGEAVSATGVTVAKTERGSAGEEKEFIRKGKGGMRNAVNYRGPAPTGAKGRLTVREERMSARAGVAKQDAAKGRRGKAQGGFLSGLFGGGVWG